MIQLRLFLCLSRLFRSCREEEEERELIRTLGPGKKQKSTHTGINEYEARNNVISAKELPRRTCMPEEDLGARHGGPR